MTSTRVDLLTALDELDSVLEQAFADNARAKRETSRERVQRWEDWMFPLPEDDQRPPAQWLDDGYEDVAYCLGDETLYERWWAVEVEAGRPWQDPPSQYGRFHTDECYDGNTLTCYWGFADKAHCVYEVRCTDSYVTVFEQEALYVKYSYLTAYGGVKNPTIRHMYSYDEVERVYEYVRDGREPAEREFAHEGRYI